MWHHAFCLLAYNTHVSKPEGCDAYMKTYASNYIKKTALATGDADILSGDILTFNTMLHCMVVDLGKPASPDEESIHRRYKQCGLTDYFVTSLERAAGGIRSAAKEALTLDIKTKEQQLARIDENIAKKTQRLKVLYLAKESLKARSRARKAEAPLPPFHNSFGCLVKPERMGSDIRFTVKSIHGKRPDQIFENEYLFETLYLDPRIRRLKSALHNMEHRKHNLQSRLARLKREAKAGIYHICYGGKKIFRRRKSAKNYNEWCDTLRRLRRRDMLLVGRHDASQGNWLVGYDPTTGTLTYRSIDGRRVNLPGVWFPYGQENINAAVKASEISKKNKKLPPDQQIEGWPPGPVSWAIRDCGNAFQVKCMISIPENPNTNTCYDDGCVAFDMNYDHLAVAELGAQGRLLKHYTVPIQMEGRTSDQITNGISEALEKVFKHAVRARKPVAMEDIKHLDKDLLYGNRKANHKISQFAYDKMSQLAENKGQKYGLAVRKSNPAYSSQIGKLKYMRTMGLSIHESAAYVIGRRAMGYKDLVPASMKHLVPAKKRGRNHWSQWAGLSTALKKVPIHKFYHKTDYHKYSTLAALKKAVAA